MRSDKNRKLPYKALVLALLALVICLSAVLFSVAYLKEQSAPVTNVFLPGDDPSVSYRLVYDLNGGSGSVDSETATADEEQHEFTVTDVTPSRNGYKFLGWADAADALGPDHHAGDTITLTKDAPAKTIYAVWEKVDDFVLDFRYTLPSSVKRTAKIEGMPTRMTAEYSGKSTHTFTVTDAPYDANFDATGLTFLGWSTVDGGQAVYPWDGSSPIDVEVTQTYTVLYAVWDFTYYVEFDRNAADGEVGKYTADGQLVNTAADDRIVLSSSEKTVSPYKLYDSGEYHYARNGYMLIGFTSNRDSTTPENSITVAKAGKNNATTVYALWFEGNYALVYDANGGSDAPATQTATDAAATHTFTLDTHLPTKPENSNGKFLGWAYSATATAEDVAFRWNGSSFTPSAVTLTAAEPTRVLYAVWEYTYTLTYHRGRASADSAMPENQTVTTTSPSYTFTIQREPVPVRSDEYLFHYWASTETRTDGEFRYCDVANYFDRAFLTASAPSLDLWPRFRPANGYTLQFDGGTPAAMNMTTTETFGSFTIPAETPKYSTDIFLGWAREKSATVADYQPGDIVIMNPDTDGHTLTLYPVKRSYDTVAVHVDYNHGSYDEKNACGDVTKSHTSYDTSRVYISPGATTYTFSSVGAFYTPTRSGYTLIGFNYRQNGTEAVFNQKNGNSGACDGKKAQITLNNVVFDASKYGTDEQRITRTQNSDGSYKYTLNLYAVWAENNVYDFYEIVFKRGNTSQSAFTLSREVLQTSGDYAVTFETTKRNVMLYSLGYKLTAYAYDPEGTQICAYVNGNVLDRDVTVSQSDKQHVTVGSYETKGKRYTLTLYAVWEPQQIFELTLDYNGGSYYSSSAKKYITSETLAKTCPPEATACTWSADDTYTSFSRSGYIFKGFAYSKDATEPDFPTKLGSFSTAITVDKSDTDHVILGTRNEIPTAGMTLYAVWEKQQVFRIVANPNNGSTTTYPRIVMVSPDLDEYTFGRTDLTVLTRDGYRLRGYAYSKDATIADFVWDGSKGFDPAVTVSKHDTDPGHEIRKYTSDGVDYTELTVYAVWEKNKQFVLYLNPNGGSVSTSSYTQLTGQDVSQVTWAAGTTVTVPTRSGYALVGYAATADAAEPLYTLTDGKLDQAITFTDTQDGVSHDTASAPERHTLTLYAVWKPLRRFAVSVDRNLPDGTTAVYTTFSDYYDKSVTNATVSLDKDNNNALTRQYYYNLKGAAYTEDAKTVDFRGDSFSVVVDMADKEHDITVTTDSGGVETVTLKLYAIWSMTLDYYGDGDGLPTSVELINPTAEERVIPIAKLIPTYQSFRFAGWAVSSNTLTPVYGAVGYYTKLSDDNALSPSITLDRNTRLKAVWVQQYTLGYSANGGDENSTPPYERAFETLSTTTTAHTFGIGTAIPTREGYTFLGWAKDSTATEPTHQPGKDLLVSGNADGSDTAVTLYAVWQEDTATEAASAAPSLETDSAAALPDAAEQNE